MDKSHDDQNFRCKILKTCVFCSKRYKILASILIVGFLSYLFFVFSFKFLIFSFALVGISLLVYRTLLGTKRKKIKHVEEECRRRKIKHGDQEDDRRRKFAKSRRSFKSRNHLIRRNTQNDLIDPHVEKKDDGFMKSLNVLLGEINPKDIRAVNLESINGKGKYSCSSPRRNVKCNIDRYDFDDNKTQDKVVRWMEDDQKNMMDLGLLEAERNKRLEGLMERRRSRKNLGFDEKGCEKTNKNVEIPAVKTTKMNPFLENDCGGKKSPGSAPSYMIRSNPFDLPYDPNEEKPDLSGDNFHEEFTVKEPVFCRHESFSIGGFSHPVIELDNKRKSSYEKNSANGFETSSLDKERGNKHIQQNSLASDDSSIIYHRNEEDGTDIQSHENDERKADINFFYGGNKKVYHASSYSTVSDMQVEVSDEDTISNLDDLDIEKDRENLLSSSNLHGDLEAIKEDGEKDDTNLI